MFSKLVVMCLLGTLGLGNLIAQDPAKEPGSSATIIIKRVVTGEDGRSREQNYKRVVRDGKVVEESGDPELLESMDLDGFGKSGKGGVRVLGKGPRGVTRWSKTLKGLEGLKDLRVLKDLKGLEGVIELESIDLKELQEMIGDQGGKIAGSVLQRLGDLKDLDLDVEVDLSGPLGVHGALRKLGDLKLNVELDAEKLPGHLRALLKDLDVDVDVRVPQILLRKGLPGISGRLRANVEEELEEEVEEVKPLQKLGTERQLEKDLKNLQREIRRLQQRIERLTEGESEPRRSGR